MRIPEAAVSALPPLYALWMDQLLQSPIPAETEATCSDCPMCDPDRSRNKSQTEFNKLTKCCTFMPELPNFLVGRIVRDEEPEMLRAKEIFDARLPAGLVVTPLGVNPPSSYSASYKANPGSFGHDLTMRCPYYMEEQGGLCGIWKHRNARCATWYCKYSRGTRGVLFWKYLDQLLTHVEKTLAHWCVLKLYPPGAALSDLFPPPPTEIDLTNPKAIWGKWWGREKEFFAECAALVEPLSWKDVAALGAADIELCSRMVQEAYAELLSDASPAQVKVAPWKRMILVGNGVYRIWAYNWYDPIDVPASLLNVLHYFDGRTVQQALQLIASEAKLNVPDSDVRILVDAGILEVTNE